MPDPGAAVTDNPLLRGLFGSFQAGAQARAQTEDIWTSLRTTAATWQFQAQGRPQPYDPAELEDAGRQILSAQGVNAATVSSFRGIAGQWLAAKTRLQGLDEGAQITSSAIFVPPWSTTASPAVPSRFRIRTQWQVTPTVGESFTRWKADELTGPLTTPAGALAQAAPTADTDSGRLLLSGGEPPVMTDFEIEQI